MVVIPFELEDELAKQLLAVACARGVTVQQFLSSRVPQILVTSDMTLIQAMSLAQHAVVKLEPWTNFEVSDLFPAADWDQMPIGLRKALGRKFREWADEDNRLLRFVRRSADNHSHYVRLHP